LGVFILRTVEDLPPAETVRILGEDSLTRFSLAVVILVGLAACSVSDGKSPI
jgi:hypothetical protein